MLKFASISCISALLLLYSTTIATTIPASNASGRHILAQYPNAIALKGTLTRQLDEVNAAQNVSLQKPRLLFRYILGSRKDGDYVVGYDADVYMQDELSAVKAQIDYPTDERMNATVNCIDIIASQSSEQAAAYAIAGGIDQRRVTIVILADKTLWLTYRATFYGR